MRGTKVLLGALLPAFGACALFCATARAGRVEYFAQVAFHPTDPFQLAVRYTYGGDGLLRSTDGGNSWQLLCDAALFDPIDTRSGPIAVASDGTTYMGVYNGLFRDDGQGCTWR